MLALWIRGEVESGLIPCIATAGPRGSIHSIPCIAAKPSILSVSIPSKVLSPLRVVTASIVRKRPPAVIIASSPSPTSAPSVSPSSSVLIRWRRRVPLGLWRSVGISRGLLQCQNGILCRFVPIIKPVRHPRPTGITSIPSIPTIITIAILSIVVLPALSLLIAILSTALLLGLVLTVVLIRILRIGLVLSVLTIVLHHTLSLLLLVLSIARTLSLSLILSLERSSGRTLRWLTLLVLLTLALV